jgi:hypothetical protein
VPAEAAKPIFLEEYAVESMIDHYKQRFTVAAVTAWRRVKRNDPPRVLYAVNEGTLHGGLGGRRGIRLHLLEGRIRVVPYRLGDAQKTRVITISARKGVAIHKNRPDSVPHLLG